MSRTMVIDGFNLFMRNFTTINYLNEEGIHIGGLGGFLRSLSFLIKEIKPDDIYIVFDGVGSSINKKNIVPEYKANRERQKLTNKNIFESIEEETEAKVNQITRLIQYLRCLPVKLICLDKIEADDIISYISLKIKSQNYIISSDSDFLQLISDNITIYRPQDKRYYNHNTFVEKFGFLPQNFILYKILVGDQADHIKGIKDLGPKTFLKLFPEVIDNILSLNNIFEIAEEKILTNVIYSRILQDKNILENTYSIMNLHKPLIDDNNVEIINNIIDEDKPLLNTSLFISYFKQDKIGDNLVKNVNFWLYDNFVLNDFN